MAMTTVDTNNKLVKYRRQLWREFVRENMFSPYMGTSLNAIIRTTEEMADGGDQLNIPIVTRLKGAGVGSNTLVGNEENIDNYGMRLRIGWARHAVVTKKSESRKESADIFGAAKPLLSDWGKQRQRDDIIAAFMSIPSETLSTNDDTTVNGILYENATAGEKNTFNASNSDRLLFGNAVSNYNATHATALGAVDATSDRFVKGSVSLLKRRASQADPAIRPFSTDDGYEHYIAFAGSNTFRDLAASLETINLGGRAREGRGMDNNPLFQDGDLLYNGVIIREVPEISSYVTNVWTSLTTAGDSSGRVEPVFLCGQQAAVLGWGQRPRDTYRKEDDYDFIKGVGVEMAYGIAKLFKKHPNSGTALKQLGVVTGFFSAPVDA
jgi:hypothetical protein